LLLPTALFSAGATPPLATCRQFEDRGKYRQALACALPLAKAGDAAAVTFVGALYALQGKEEKK
jgi:hypothetical protein